MSKGKGKGKGDGGSGRKLEEDVHNVNDEK